MVWQVFSVANRMSQADSRPESSLIDSSISRVSQAGLNTGRDAVEPVSANEQIDPPPGDARSTGGPAQTSQTPNAANPVPPPPPPRATLPPVRPASSQRPSAAIPPPAPAAAAPSAGSPQPTVHSSPVTPPNPSPQNGVGSARGVRWRGELDGVGKPRGARTETAPQQSSGSATSGPSKNPPSSAPPAPGELPADAPADSEETAEAATDRVAKSAPPWLVSMIVHLVALLILAFITTPVGSEIGRIVLSSGQSESEDSTELAEFSINPEDTPFDTDVPIEAITDFEVPSVFDSLETLETPVVTPVNVGVGDLTLEPVAPMFGGRTGAMRDALLKIYGGTEETEEAVRLGLAWLKRNQQKDGSWSMLGPYNDGSLTENRIAATSMALLAFLGDGNTHFDGEYKKEVNKGIRALVKMQDRSGFFSKGPQGGSHERMYSQAQATIALCELYGITKDSWLRPYAQAALKFAVDSQSKEGGWRYKPNFDSDTSVTGWFVLALESGRNSGLDIGTSTLPKVNYYLNSVASDNGALYAYQPSRAPTTTMTAEGLLCRQYLGWDHDHPAMKEGIDTILFSEPFDIKSHSVYYWYYATQVLHHYGGEPWEQWNNVMRVELPKHQTRAGREKGSFPPQRDSYGVYGRLYTTCLSIYCLEVYYRHLPLYSNINDSSEPDS